MEEISWTHSQEETWGGGQSRGGGCRRGGLQSLKISCAAERYVGLGRGSSASIPSISAISAAFSTISTVLPYKLKTMAAVPDKPVRKKERSTPLGKLPPFKSGCIRFIFLIFFPCRLDEEIRPRPSTLNPEREERRNKSRLPAAIVFFPI